MSVSKPREKRGFVFLSSGCILGAPFCCEKLSPIIKVSNFDQIVTGLVGRLALGLCRGARSTCHVGIRSVLDAKEAMLLACLAESDEEKLGLLDLSRTWTHKRH